MWKQDLNEFMCYSRMSSGRQPVSSTCVARSRKKRYKRNPAKVRVYVLGSFISQLFIIFVFRHDLVKSNHNRQPRLSSANRRQFPHHDIVTVHPDSLICFRELELEMASRVEENCLTQHSIVKKVPGITTGFIEIKEYFNQSIKDFVVAVLNSTSSFDPATDVCLTRGLLNYYSTNLKFSSRDHSPLMKPHRDNVNGADVAIVVGLSDASDFSGALLFVSTTKRGKVWYDNMQEETVAKSSVIGLNVTRGIVVTLWNDVEHYVGLLQCGKRFTIVIHVTFQK